MKNGWIECDETTEYFDLGYYQEPNKHAKSPNLEMDGLIVVELPSLMKSMHKWEQKKQAKLQPNAVELLNLPNLFPTGIKKDMLNHQIWKWMDLMWWNYQI